MTVERASDRLGPCPICGGPGDQCHARVVDHWHGVPGSWSTNRCRSCGGVWLHPRPSSTELGAFYVDYHTHSPTGRSTGLARAKAIVIGALDRLPTRSAALRRSATTGYVDARRGAGARVLDIGGGGGASLDALSRDGTVGIGIDTDLVAVGQWANNGAVADADALPFADDSYDFVLMSHVIEHVSRPNEVMREVHRVLAPGGVVSIMTPNVESRLARKWGEFWRGLEAPRHLQVFTARSLSQLVTQAGLTIVTQMTTEHLAYEIEIASRRAARQSAGERWNVASVATGLAIGLLEERRERAAPSSRLEGEELVIVACKPHGAAAP